jgi:hypothetical protein
MTHLASKGVRRSGRRSTKAGAPVLMIEDWLSDLSVF